jgi:Flp pilus assembly protein TadD
LVLLLAVLALSLTACSTPTVKQSGQSAFAELYEGKSGLLHGTQLPASSAEEAISRGDAAVEGGDLDRALFEYIRALDFNAHNADVFYKIGAIHAYRDNTRLADLAFRWALREDPKNAGALQGLGILLLDRREYDEAKRLLSEAVQVQPRLWRAHSALGVIADLRQDFQAAQAHYDKALAVVPNSAMLLNNLGYSQYLSGDWNAAIQSLKRALTVNSDYHLAWRNLALIYTRKGRYAEAVEALSKTEDVAKAYNDVGYVSLVAGRLDEAEGLFEEAMRLSPTYYVMASENAERVRLLKDLSPKYARR